MGAFVRDVELPLSGWLGSGALLLLSSLVFWPLALLIAQIKSQQIMSVVANITYLGLAIVGGFMDAYFHVSKVGSEHF